MPAIKAQYATMNDIVEIVLKFNQNLIEMKNVFTENMQIISMNPDYFVLLTYKRFISNPDQIEHIQNVIRRFFEMNALPGDYIFDQSKVDDLIRNLTIRNFKLKYQQPIFEALNSTVSELNIVIDNLNNIMELNETKSIMDKITKMDREIGYLNYYLVCFLKEKCSVDLLQIVGNKRIETLDKIAKEAEYEMYDGLIDMKSILLDVKYQIISLFAVLRKAMDDMIPIVN